MELKQQINVAAGILAHDAVRCVAQLTGEDPAIILDIIVRAGIATRFPYIANDGMIDPQGFWSPQFCNEVSNSRWVGKGGAA